LSMIRALAESWVSDECFLKRRRERREDVGLALEVDGRGERGRRRSVAEAELGSVGGRRPSDEAARWEKEGSGH
jgi:hypothetical protein